MLDILILCEGLVYFGSILEYNFDLFFREYNYTFKHLANEVIIELKGLVFDLSPLFFLIRFEMQSTTKVLFITISPLYLSLVRIERIVLYDHTLFPLGLFTPFSSNVVLMVP